MRAFRVPLALGPMAALGVSPESGLNNTNNNINLTCAHIWSSLSRLQHVAGLLVDSGGGGGGTLRICILHTRTQGVALP